MSGSSCGVFLAKYALCIFNFLFFITGTIVLIVGVWLQIDKASLIALFKMVENEHVQQFTQPQVIEQMAYVLIAIGAIMFIMSFLGYCGALRESRCLLTTYGVLLIALLILEIAAGGLALFYKEKAHVESKNFLQTTITRYYSTGEKADAVTLMWNHMMSQLQCCGVNDYRDFEKSDAWFHNKGNRTMPEACCILKDAVKIIPRDTDCVTNPSESNSYYKKGCYESINDWLVSNRIIMIGVLLGIAIIQLLAIFIAFCLVKAFAKYHHGITHHRRRK